MTAAAIAATSATPARDREGRGVGGVGGEAAAGDQVGGQDRGGDLRAERRADGAHDAR